ncbi:tail fiber domain-containing protein [Phytobacter diazotrophicus]|uniref:tail fiber domain-containing protein n=1 Tax=Phytobacter diazotrophicus TaxID=395631 RepID=UPI002935AC71|nr:tail fiber domain-containing protein [Phytobacter diazotrophicus]MDV2901783.1 tail fiber domain-containing protein [Phytobacter diazotrophicus]
MIYTTGSIAVNGNTLTGTGTNFTAAGSLIRVGCSLISLTTPPQVFQITAINSATQLTVTPAANPAIAAGTAYAILLSDSLSVDGLAQNIAETLTLYQRNMSGFADVMNASGDVTITTNGAAITVPGQKSLAKKGANSDITSLSGLTTALSIGQGGTGAKTAADAATALSLGKDSTPWFSSIELSAATPFIDFHLNKGAEDYNVRLINTSNTILQLVGQFDATRGFASRAGMDGVTSALVPWNFYWGYNGASGLTGFVGVTNLGQVSFTTSSDKLLKKDIEYVLSPAASLSEVLQWKPAHFRMKARGVIPESEDMLGFIANDLVTVSPECVGGSGLVEGYDEENPADAYYLKEVPMIAKLTQAIQAQQKLIDDLTARVAELETKKSEVPAAE